MSREASSQVVGNLPPDAIDIVGRGREVSEAKRLLSGTRLLMLTGAGGVGKTRLALKVAAEVRRAFADGVWLVELASLHDEELLALTVATALGIRDQSVRPSLETLADYLRDKRLLLVLDNCEHLLDACATLAGKLLGTAPELRILATSRESLRAEGETILAVPPLAVPASDGELTAREIARYEAVRLLITRADSVVPEFTVDAENSARVARLCRRLEGIPLAIELAAVHLRALSLDQIIDRLDDRYRFLTKGYRTALPRHQTLRATIDWSFGLCSAQEQILWARLSVFSGGFDLDAAEQVCAGDPIAEEDVFELVSALIDKSILTREDYGVHARYRMLETLRQYGHERLIETGTRTVCRRRHRDYYRYLAEQADADWFSPRQTESLTKLRRDLANIRVALDFCLTEPGEVSAGLSIAAALFEHWTFYGAHGEARHWIDRALARAREPESEPARVEALAVDATIALYQGDTSAALSLMRECRDCARRSGIDRPGATIMGFSGLAAFLQGDLEAAVSELENALDGYDTDSEDFAGSSDSTNVWRNSFHLALAAAFLGDDRAAAFASRCRKMAETAGAQWATSWGLYAVGIERWRSGDIRHAAALFRDSLRDQFSLDDRWGPTFNTEALAWTAAAEGQDPERAAQLLGAAEALRQAVGVPLSGYRPWADDHEICEAKLRRSLGDEVYAAAFQRGMRLDFDKAIAYALGETTEATPSTPAAPAGLTSRERQVAELVAEGMSNKEIAARLVVAQRTAEGHVEHILTKLGFTSRTQIATWVTRHREAPRPKE